MQKDICIGDVQSGGHDGQNVELKGWINRTRGSNKIRFIVLRDSTGRIQCVAKRETIGDETFEALKSALIETSVIIRGKVNVDERSEGGHELVVDSAEIIGPVNPENPFPITESAMANAENNFGLNSNDLYISKAIADEGPTLKRFRPRARGRAGRINKRTSHLIIELASTGE